MKILSLQFKNLNSLYGEWKIDFTNNTYQQNGLFVLSGPTGAGKTTILDAICLALYGQTPRMGKITKNTNEIMSKNTGECFAEIVFEIKNIAYVSRFEQRRAKNSNDGNLQEAKHYVSELKTKKIISEKRTESYQEIVNLTGMDFSRFTRSILLAQGAFDSFLKAENEEKSTLLEQITGTEIYSDISKAVFLKCKEHKIQKEQLEKSLENCQSLSQEQENLLDKTKKELTEKQITLNKKLQDITIQINWLEQIKTLEQDLQNNTQKKQSFIQEQEKAQEQKEQLIKANNAEFIRAEYELVQAKEKEYYKIQNELDILEKNLPEQEKVANNILQEFNQTQKKLKEQQTFLQTQEPLYQKVLQLDTTLKNQEKELTTLTNTINQTQQEIKNTKENHQKEEKTFLQIKNEYTKLQTWFEQNQSIALLKEQLSKIEQSFSLWQTTYKKGINIKQEITAQENLKKTITKELQDVKAKILYLQNTEKENLQTYQEKEKKYTTLLDNKLLREFENELKHLRKEKGFIERILSLEEHRKNLEDNKPCPLCGALHHPYAEGNIPSLTEYDININKLEEKIETIKEIEKELTQLKLKLTEIKGQINVNQTGITEKEKNLSIITQELEKKQNERQQLLEEFSKNKEILLQEVKPFNIYEIDHNSSKLIDELKQYITLWKNNEIKKTSLEESINKKQTNLAILENQYKDKEKQLTEQEKIKQEKQTEFDINQKERITLFGTKKPEQEKLLLQQQIQQLEKQLEEERAKYTDFTSILTKTTEQIKLKKEILLRTNNELTINTEKFNLALGKNNFSSKEEYIQAILPIEEKEKLKNYITELEKNILLTQNKEKEYTEKLQTEKNKKLTLASLEEIKEEANIKQTELQSILQELGSIEEKLRQNSMNKQKNIQTKQEVEKLQKELEHWELLDKLIGSADGKKFRTFAQGITFEKVIYFANQKLKQLQKRYLLIRDTEEPLSLNILDDYQGGEIRSVKTLSGGESFIVSLSLALGLAQMASNTISVDSLFLDEGFGTLDEDSLEMALSTLATMQQQGKLIGIISHIPLLKERIPTQINIIPQSGGKSIIEGAGCEKIQ